MTLTSSIRGCGEDFTFSVSKCHSHTIASDRISSSFENSRTAALWTSTILRPDSTDLPLSVSRKFADHRSSDSEIRASLRSRKLVFVVAASRPTNCLFASTKLAASTLVSAELSADRTDCLTLDT